MDNQKLIKAINMESTNVNLTKSKKSTRSQFYFMRSQMIGLTK
jgi:hypothetical protein